ncbi:ATP-binding protein [Actinomadura hibisca]|uniref:ATP-binding protein n=1 Tax=Actinomadura hibisca TaxID=68565 RepID=UPI0008331230|nr:ATP-binding protein [Actinomadura hibisca]
MPPHSPDHRPPERLREEKLERAALAVPSSVGLLRDLAEAHLHKWGLAAIVDDSLLVVSELVTNAVAKVPGHLIGFALLKWPTVLVIEVSDEHQESAVLQKPGAEGESGRGLFLVEALALHWGQRRSAGGWKTVYALMEIPPSCQT